MKNIMTEKLRRSDFEDALKYGCATVTRAYNICRYELKMETYGDLLTKDEEEIELAIAQARNAGRKSRAIILALRDRKMAELNAIAAEQERERVNGMASALCVDYNLVKTVGDNLTDGTVELLCAGPEYQLLRVTGRCVFQLREGEEALVTIRKRKTL